MPSRASNAALIVESRAAADILYPWTVLGRLLRGFFGICRRRVKAIGLLPSPLVGAGGEIEHSEIEPGEGLLQRDPSPALAPLGHPLPQGERGSRPSRGSSKPLQKTRQIVGDVVD